MSVGHFLLEGADLLKLVVKCFEDIILIDFTRVINTVSVVISFPN